MLQDGRAMEIHCVTKYFIRIENIGQFQVAIKKTVVQLKGKKEVYTQLLSLISFIIPGRNVLRLTNIERESKPSIDLKWVVVHF